MAKNWRNSKEYRIWRVAVIRRDNVCQCCGSMDKRHAHHISDASNHPERRYDVENGVTLCNSRKNGGKACHSAYHNDFKGGYRRKCTAKDFKRFLKLTGSFLVK